MCGIKLKYVRWGVQFGAFYLAFPLLLPVFYCPYQFPWIMCTVCAVFWCPLKYIRGQTVYFLSGLTLTTGRGFCGWVCPYGSLQDLFNKVGRKFGDAGDFLVKDHPRLKYVVLAATLLLVSHMLGWIHIPLSDLIIPSAPIWVPLVLGFFLLVSVFVARFWCRFLCPLGGVMSLFNKVSLLSIKLDDKKCSNCSSCKKPCVMVSDEKKVDTKSTDCIVCGECIQECPKDALSYSFRSSK